MKRSHSEAWEDFEQDKKASGGGNTLRGLAKIALTCFVEPMQRLEKRVEFLERILERSFEVVECPCCDEWELLDKNFQDVVIDSSGTEFTSCDGCLKIFCDAHTKHFSFFAFGEKDYCDACIKSLGII